MNRQELCEPEPWLIAIFDDETHAQMAALLAAETGIDPDSIAIGDDADAVIEASAAPRARGPVRGVLLGVFIGMASGAIVGLPLALFAVAGFGAALQIATMVMCVAFGGFFVAFVAGAVALERSEQPVSVVSGVTLVMPDTEPARAVLLRSAPARIDLAFEEGREQTA